MAPDTVLTQTTIEDEDRAKGPARGAVEARLAACAHADGPRTAGYPPSTDRTASGWAWTTVQPVGGSGRLSPVEWAGLA